MSTLMDQLKQNVESKKNRDVEIFTLSEEVKDEILKLNVIVYITSFPKKIHISREWTQVGLTGFNDFGDHYIVLDFFYWI